MADIDNKNTFANDKQTGYPGSRQENVNDGSAVVEQPRPNSNVVTPTVQLSFQDMYKKFNPYQPPTKDDLEKERRKLNRNMVMASIGNGLNAFHQAYSNARGIKPIANNVSMTGKILDRYEKIKKERDALNREYANGMIRAAQMDQQQNNWREQMQYNKEKDQRNFDYTKEKDKQQQENWQKTFDRQSEQWQQEFKQREQQYGRQNALAWANHKLSVQAQKDNKELGQQRIAALGARGVRGKQLAFSDGSGNNVGIYENVWKGSMEQVYDAMVNEFETRVKNGQKDLPRGLSRKATAQQKDDFVKQHWHKSSDAKKLMGALSRIDPATMTSATGAYDQYEVKKDDYSQYEVK